MTEAIEQFFATLPARAPQLLRSSLTGTLRIDLTDDGRTEHWVLRIRPGALDIDRGLAEADAIWYSSVDLFDRLVTGRSQAIAALFRNESTFSGRVTLFLAFRLFFPPAPGTRDPREVAREKVRRAR
ncbi:hypothetical protein GCM10009541_19970 [Micromonospora gifhornensis]|uniref:SCP2 domain-containing protein n=1 Tax=Micromonospora gifhornensis TaxID=84594 RepID=A0ABQ4I966_9ACTN|nr:SCP2 sterol-binding domain-containing protein [Micromonospora gifhornensis]GIJ14449.1 hypothetical protein Vgi01_11330 [Micromonospora gifhornensis]